MIRSWYRKLFGRPAAPVRRPAKAARTRLGFEGLEDRALPSFLTPVTYPAGYAVVASAVADFNGDGKPDIVTVGNSGGRGMVDVQLNNGDGTFTAAAPAATGNSPFDVEVGDFDGDGHEDVITLASYYTGAMTVIRGNGDGTFQSYTPYTVLTPPTEVQVEDVNGDGKDDVVAGNRYFNTVSVFLNDGTGRLGGPATYTAGGSPYAVAVGDLNGDGKNDVVTANPLYNGSVGVQLNNGNGTLQPPTVAAFGTMPLAETLGDFNGDGKLDLATVSASPGNTLRVMAGNGDGTFQPAVSYPLGYQPLDIRQGDFNGDGKTDLIERTANGFMIEAGNGDGTFAAAVLAAGGAGNTTIVGDFNGDGSSDIASTSGTNLSVQINADDGITGVPVASGMQLTVPPTAAAGLALPVTVTAVDASGNPTTTFAGTVTITTSDPAHPFGWSYTFSGADAGTHTFNIVLSTLGTQTVTATSATLGSISDVVTVTPAPAARFAVTAPVTSVAGQPASVTVTALDAFGNMVPDYTGTVSFRGSDAQADLPAGYTFTTADGGTHTFSAVLKTAGPQTVTAFDSVTPAILGTSGADQVTPIAAVSLSLSGGGGFIGVAHPVAVTARDPFGNVATGYTGTARLVSSDPATVVGADATLVNGVGTINVTPMTLGAQSLTAADVDGLLASGSESVIVTPGWAARFEMTPVPATTAGITQFFTVTAFDAFGNRSTVYTGTAVFGSSDVQAGLPAAYTFTAADGGTHTFGVTMRTAGSQSLTVRDWGGSATGTQTGIVVTSAAPVSLSVTQLHGGVAGVAQPLTVTARDAFGNVATGYRGTVTFATSDTIASIPATYTFTATDAGTHTFSVTFKSSGGQTFAVQDTVNTTWGGSQRDINITPAAAASFVVRAPSNVTLGVAFNITVQVVDAFGNVVPAYTGKVHFTGPSGGGNLLPPDYTFTAADAGSHVFSVTLASTGTQTIGVQDTVNGAVKGQTSVKVVTQSTSGGGGTGGGGGGGGTTSGGGGGGGGGGL